MRVGNKIVQASALKKLYRARVSWWAVLALVLAAAVAITVALVISDAAGTYGELLQQWWQSVVTWIRGRF
jgi:uncharacterized membrane-anchored protein